MATKKQAQSIHFRRRAIQRIGVSITKKDRRLMVQQIKSGKAQFLEKHSLRVNSWKFSINGVDCEVLYDKKRGSLITIWKI